MQPAGFYLGEEYHPAAGGRAVGGAGIDGAQAQSMKTP